MAKRVYLAGPLFSIHEREYLEKIEEKLSGKSKEPKQEGDFFLPHRDAGDVGIAGDRNDIFEKDIKHLEEAEVVVALLDGVDVDSGTAVELGYASALNRDRTRKKTIKIFGILTDRRSYNQNDKTIQKLNNMIWGVCDHGKNIYVIENDNDYEKLAEEIYKHLGKDP